MTVLYDDLISTAYGQMYVTSVGDDTPDPVEAFAGQANGLCGARVPGALFLVTGRHDGKRPATTANGHDEGFRRRS